MNLKRVIRRIYWKLESVPMPRFTLITAGIGTTTLIAGGFLALALRERGYTGTLHDIIGGGSICLFFISFLVIGVVTLVKKESIFTYNARQWGFRFFSREIWAQIEGVVILVVTLLGLSAMLIGLLT